MSRVQASREEVVDELTVLTTNARRTYIEALLLFADEAGVYPATSFARRRHLFQRVLLISKEAVMSSRRIVASCAAMGAVVVMGGWYGAEAFPLTAVPPCLQRGQAGQPRDLRPGEARPATRRETRARRRCEGWRAAVRHVSGAGETAGSAWRGEGRRVDADAARTLYPTDPKAFTASARFYNRAGRFDETIDMLEQAAAVTPSDPAARHLVATFYEEKVRKDAALSAADRLRYTRAGIAAEDQALALNADYVDAMIVKNILLRHQANAETSPSTRAQLIADADALRNRAIQLQQSRQLLNSANQPSAVRAGVDGRMPPPPPPPPPPGSTDPASLVDGMSPVRVGGSIKQPTKLVNMSPVYPEEAKAAAVQGVVIIEAIIDPGGLVSSAKVLRSIPLLDEAAVTAVKQWQFTPTLLNGAAVPVIMTVTVNFTLQ